MIIKIYYHTYTYISYLFGQGKVEISQGKVREKSGNFDILCDRQPWIMFKFQYYHQSQPLCITSGALGMTMFQLDWKHETFFYYKNSIKLLFKISLNYQKKKRI